jgi:hypothetical protein
VVPAAPGGTSGHWPLHFFLLFSFSLSFLYFFSFFQPTSQVKIIPLPCHTNFKLFNFWANIIIAKTFNSYTK